MVQPMEVDTILGFQNGYSGDASSSSMSLEPPSSDEKHEVETSHNPSLINVRK